MRYALILILVATVTASARQTEPAFEVVSVKENTGEAVIRPEPTPPDGYRRTNLPLWNHLSYAFDIPQLSRIAGVPEWVHVMRYDIAGKAAGPITEQQRRSMLRQVLASRFGLRTHVEQREQTIYVMTMNRSDKRLGPGLTLRSDCAAKPCVRGGTGTQQGVDIRATTLAQFADGMLSSLLEQVVRDETGVEGVFDVEVSWRPGSGDASAADGRADMFTALREQLGLKLEPSRRPVDVLVIDHIERPSGN
jgi:uncharacterized protein (TIGR03435 family)